MAFEQKLDFKVARFCDWLIIHQQLPNVRFYVVWAANRLNRCRRKPVRFPLAFFFASIAVAMRCVRKLNGFAVLADRDFTDIAFPTFI